MGNCHSVGAAAAAIEQRPEGRAVQTGQGNRSAWDINLWDKSAATEHDMRCMQSAGPARMNERSEQSDPSPFALDENICAGIHSAL